MAKLPRTGVAYRSLESEVTLAEIVASLGLKPLSKKVEREIRDRLPWQRGTSRILPFKSGMSLVP